MIVRELGAVCRVVALEWRLQRRDPGPVVTVTVMPVLLTALMLPTFDRLAAVSPVTAGSGSPSGAAQAVPGMSVMFSLFLVSSVGFVFYRDHGWGTWGRYLGSGISHAGLVVGKLVVPTTVLLGQLGLLLGTGRLLFGLHVAGSAPALAAVVISYSLALVTLAFLCVAVCRTVMQMTALTNVLALVLAGLGGAVVPGQLLPPWAAVLTPCVPTHYAVSGMQAAIAGADLAGVSGDVRALLAFAAGTAVPAVALFRPNEPKVTWS